MNRIERSIFVLMLVLTAGMVLYVKSVADRERRITPKPVVTNLTPKMLMGKHPDFRGRSNAPFALVEFADYQCPACIATHLRVIDLMQQHSDKVKLLFHHFPLPMHSQAKPAAEAAEAARMQGQFWEMHDRLMALHGHLMSSDIQTCIRELKLDSQRFNHDAVIAQQQVEGDMQLGKSIPVQSTPTFFLCRPNGTVVRLGALEQAEDYLNQPML